MQNRNLADRFLSMKMLGRQHGRDAEVRPPTLMIAFGDEFFQCCDISGAVAERFIRTGAGTVTQSADIDRPFAVTEQ